MIVKLDLDSSHLTYVHFKIILAAAASSYVPLKIKDPATRHGQYRS